MGPRVPDELIKDVVKLFDRYQHTDGVKSPIVLRDQHVVKLFDSEVQQGHGQDQGTFTCQSEMLNCMTQRSSKGMVKTKGPSHAS